MIDGAAFDGRAKRLMAAAASGLVGRFTTLVAPLLVTPALLQYFGDAQFGVWATAVSITTIAVVADFGIGNGLLTRVSAAHGSGNVHAVRSYISSALAVLSLVAIVLLAALLTVFLVLDGNKVALSIFAAFLIGLPGTVLYQTLYAVQRVPLATSLQIAGSVLAMISALVAIHLMLPSWTVALAYAMPPIFVTYLGTLFVFGRHPELRPSLPLVKRAPAIDLIRLGSRFFLLSILTAVGLNIDNVLIAITLSPEAVAPYYIPMRLGSLLTLVIAALFMPMWGANGEAIAKGEYEWVWQGAMRMSLAGAGFVSVAGAALVALSGPIIDLWVGRAFEDQALVLTGFVLFSIVTAATSPFNMILNAMGRAGVQIWPWLAFVVITIIVKSLTVTEALWTLPAVSAAAYGVLVMPTIFITARQLIKSAANAPQPGA